MQIFALQTDKNEIIRRFCHDHDGECVVLMTHYHGLSFLFASIREIFLTIILLAIGIVAWIFGFPMAWTLGILALLWFVLVFFNVSKAYLDWYYDFIIVTTDKIILVDQTSIFHRDVMPIHIENIGGISSFTQFWNIFPFGGLCIHLKEGRGGKDITKKYIPRSQEVAGKISDVVTRYQRHQYKGEDLQTPKEKSPLTTGTPVIPSPETQSEIPQDPNQMPPATQPPNQTP